MPFIYLFINCDLFHSRQQVLSNHVYAHRGLSPAVQAQTGQGSLNKSSNPYTVQYVCQAHLLHLTL